MYYVVRTVPVIVSVILSPESVINLSTWYTIHEKKSIAAALTTTDKLRSYFGERPVKKCYRSLIETRSPRR